jgi:hypothetical protein
MSNSVIATAPKRVQLAYIATIAGTLLGGFAAAPAYSADLYAPGYGPHGYVPPPYFQGGGYGCSPCGCSSCGCSPCGCGDGCGRGHVFEQRAVEREYIERRYATPCCEYGGYGYGSLPWQPGHYGYGGPRPYFPYGYGGVRSHAGYYGYTE